MADYVRFTRPTGGATRRGRGLTNVDDAFLRHRHVEALALDTILPTETLSVYDFAVDPPDLAPTEDEADELIRDVERCYPDPATLDREITRWWET